MLFWLMYGLLVVLGSIGFLELFLRLIYVPEAVKLRVYMNELARSPGNFQILFENDNFRFVPKSSGEMVHSEFSMKVTHDEFGFRNPCVPPSPKMTYSLMVGDSFIYGLGVDDPNTFGCRLNGIPGGRRFYTMGRPSASFAEYIRMVSTHSGRLEQSMSIDKANGVFVMLFVGNDFEGMLSFAGPAAVPERPAGLPAQEQSRRLEILGWMNRHVAIGALSTSYLAQSVKLSLLRFKTFNKFDGIGEYEMNYCGSTYYPSDAPPKVVEVKMALDRFRNETRLLGFGNPSFLLLPDASDIDPLRLRRDAAIGRFDPDKVDIAFKYNAILRACAELGLYCLDLRPALHSTPTEMNRYFYVSDCHLRPEGVARVSEYIAAALRRPGREAGVTESR